MGKSVIIPIVIALALFGIGCNNFVDSLSINKDVNGTILVGDRHWGILMLKFNNGRVNKKQLITGNIEKDFGSPCLYNNSCDVLFESLDASTWDCSISSYHLSDNKINKILALKSNLTMPSVSHNDSMYALFESKSTKWDDNHGAYVIYKFGNTIPYLSINVMGIPSRASWNNNDSIIYFPLSHDKKNYIAKWYLYKHKIDTLCIGSNPALSHDGSKIAFIENDKIQICDTLGHNAKDIVSGHLFVKPFNETSIAWSPNDKYLIFCGGTLLDRLFPAWNIYLVSVANKNKLTTICENTNPDLDWK